LTSYTFIMNEILVLYIAMNTPERFQQLPKAVKSPRAKLVYYHILNKGKATLDQICETLNLKKITTYPVLSSLVEKGLLNKSGEMYSLPN